MELSASPDDPDRTIIGFVPFDTRAIDCRSRSTSTPATSAARRPGLAFTLALIDELSPGALTGDQNVAVTGTIDLERQRRRDRRAAAEGVGGAPARGPGVPRPGVAVGRRPPRGVNDFEDAGRGEVEIIPVATLDEALAALERLGGDPLVAVS